MLSLLCKLFPSEPGQRVELSTAVVLAESPLGCDPTFLLKLVQGRIERAVADLKYFARDLSQALADRPAIQRLKRQDL